MTFLDLFCLTFPFWRSFPAIQSYLIHIVPANERNLLYPDLHPSHAFSGEKVKGSLQCTSTVHQTTGSDTCPRSFDNCQPALTLSLPEDELKCKSEVVETAGSSSLSPRFHSWRDSPWAGHQVLFLDGVLRVLTHCCFNSWGKGGRGGLGWPYVCCHRVIYDWCWLSCTEHTQTDLKQKILSPITLVTINPNFWLRFVLAKCGCCWQQCAGGFQNTLQMGMAPFCNDLSYAGWRRGMTLRRTAHWWFSWPCLGNSSFESSLLSPSP